MKKLAIIAAALLLLVNIENKAQQIKPFKAGDRVTFVGNSITDGGHYHSYIWLYYMTHFPTQRMWMSNCGIGGDTSEEILNRIDGDVFTKNPTVLTLTFGMNDSGYLEYNGDNASKFADERVVFAKKNFEAIETKLKAKNGIRTIMVGTSPYDQTSTFNDNILKNKNDAIVRMIDLQKDAAVRNSWEFIDFNAPMVAINAEQQKTDPKFTICGNDRIHPDNDGHMVMAYLFLKAQGMSGKNIADISINAKSQTVNGSDNCTITDLHNRSGVVSFDYLAQSLPLPLDTIAHGWGFKRPQAQITRLVPTFMQEMDNEKLTVSGLKGNYELKIDGEHIDNFSAQQLAEGINLAQYSNTPQYQQALTVMALNEERWEIERRFRDFAWLKFDYFLKKGVTDIETPEAIALYKKEVSSNFWLSTKGELYGKMIHPEVRDAYEQEMNMLIDRIYEINKPVKRHIVISPIL